MSSHESLNFKLIFKETFRDYFSPITGLYRFVRGVNRVVSRGDDQRDTVLSLNNQQEELIVELENLKSKVAGLEKEKSAMAKELQRLSSEQVRICHEFENLSEAHGQHELMLGRIMASAQKGLLGTKHEFQSAFAAVVDVPREDKGPDGYSAIGKVIKLSPVKDGWVKRVIKIGKEQLAQQGKILGVARAAQSQNMKGFTVIRYGAPHSPRKPQKKSRHSNHKS